MRTLLITISYDGTLFCGWQRQQGQRTIQEEIESALEKIHKNPTAIHGSGRTDSGVHAIGQVATFESPIDSIPHEKYPFAINGFLPPDIRVIDCIHVPSGFHARFNAVSRTYRYFMHCGAIPFAHQMRYIWSIYHQPNIKKLNYMASRLQGEIDCSTFSAAGDKSKSKFRYIEKAHFFYENDLLVFEITANAFLWKMVRSLVGTLVDCEKKNSDEVFAEVLNAKNRSFAGQTAPPQGLFLWQVSFEGERRGNLSG